MKKVILWILVVVVIITIIFCSLYLIDINRIKSNKPVVFSTWGYDSVINKETIDNSSKEKTNIKWEEISDDGVNEEKLLQNIDSNILQEIASELQTLCDEIEEKQREDPNSVLRGDWLKDVTDSPRYKKIIAIGSSAMKPLYLIIYKSDNQGMYEYICSLALEELSGFNFDEDGDGIKWATSKQFLKEFDKKILDK